MLKKILKKSVYWAGHGKRNRAGHWYLIRERERRRRPYRMTEWCSSVREVFARKKA